MKRLQQQMPVVLLLVLVILLASQGAHADSIIFSNFGPADNPYSTSVGWGVLGSAKSPPGLSHAMGFTSGGDFFFTDLFLPLAGTGPALVALMDDAGGKPGAVMESWQIALSTPVAHAHSTLHPRLSAGAQYWIGVFPGAPDSYIGWSQNSIDYVGPYAYANSSDPASAPWDPTPPFTTQSAFEVQGRPVPVPSTLLLLGSGLLGLTAWRRRRKG